MTQSPAPAHNQEDECNSRVSIRTGSCSASLSKDALLRFEFPTIDDSGKSQCAWRPKPLCFSRGVFYCSAPQRRQGRFISVARIAGGNSGRAPTAARNNRCSCDHSVFPTTCLSTSKSNSAGKGSRAFSGIAQTTTGNPSAARPPPSLLPGQPPLTKHLPIVPSSTRQSGIWTPWPVSP